MLNLVLSGPSLTTAQAILSSALGGLSILLSAIANNAKWSARAKVAVSGLVAVALAVLQALVQGKLNGTSLVQAAFVIYSSSQVFYRVDWMKTLAALVESATSPGGSAANPVVTVPAQTTTIAGDSSVNTAAAEEAKP